MGIQTWFARFILPHAPMQQVVPDHHASHVQAAPQTRIQTNQLHLVDENPVPAIEIPKKLTHIAAFRLIVIELSKTQMAILDFPLIRSFDSKFTALLAAILFALKWNVASSDSWEINQFDWPLPGFDSNNNSQDAVFAVKGFLKHRCHFDQYQHILLLGPMSIQQVLNLDGSFDDQYGVVMQDGKQYACSYSLDQMRQLASCKMEAWLHLSPMIFDHI